MVTKSKHARADEGLPILSKSLNADLDEQRALEQQRRQRQRRRRLVGLAIAILLGLGICVLWRQSRRGATENPYAAVVRRYREATGNFDGVALVRENGREVFAEWSGLASEELEVPIARDSVFPIGSNSKLFVAVALYQLQERGRVNLTDAINDWLTPEDFAAFGHKNQTQWCPRVGRDADAPVDEGEACETITFVQLLHMGSGVGDSLNCDNVDPRHCYNGADDLALYKGSIGAHVGRFINDPLVFRPDTNYSYANPNFVLLTYMVEKISGQDFGSYIQEHIAKPLGLQDTYFDAYSGQLDIHRGYVEQYAHYYIQDEGGDGAAPRRVATGTCSPYMHSGAVSGTGGIRSTTDEMQRWYLDLFGNRGRDSKLLKEASVRMILDRANPVNPSYAQGIGVAKVVDGWPQSIAYCGGMKCAVTCMGMRFPKPETSVLVSVFSNHMHFILSSPETWAKFQHLPMAMLPRPDPTLFADGNAGGAIVVRAALMEAYENKTGNASAAAE